MKKVISVMKKVMLITLLFAVGGIHTYGAPVRIAKHTVPGTLCIWPTPIII